jgi:hypothetical protein
MFFLVDGQPPPVCREGQDNPARCEAAGRWLQAMILLTRDLFGGSQHILTD